MGKKFIPAKAALSRTVAEMLKMVRLLNLWRNEKRVILYKGSDEQERVGEHSAQLAMFAWYLRDRHLPHLNRERVLMYALVHDLPEVYAGDTPAFPDKSGTLDVSGVNRSTKAERERRAIFRLEQEYGGVIPWMIDALRQYEKQEDEESRFIQALDKFLADLNVYEDGGRTDKILQVTFEERVRYKRPRISAHPFLLELYDEFCRFCKDYRPDVHFQPPETADAT